MRGSGVPSGRDTPDRIGPILLDAPRDRRSIARLSPAVRRRRARCALARETLRHRGAALLGPEGAPGRGLSSRAVRAILAVRGRVVVMGMGKSGHVGRKIAATLASTGTPALFVHPAEASHGDLGMVTRGDVVLAISNSRRERRDSPPSCRRSSASACTLVAMTGRADSHAWRAMPTSCSTARSTRRPAR